MQEIRYQITGSRPDEWSAGAGGLPPARSLGAGRPPTDAVGGRLGFSARPDEVSW
jgi:hypothetical protein